MQNPNDQFNQGQADSIIQNGQTGTTTPAMTPIASNASQGSTIDQAQQALAQQQQLNANGMPQSTPGTGGSLLERLLPTIGSVGGGILGDLVAPVAGGIAGSAAGSALGKVLEDKLTGQSAGSGVLGAAGEGALGQGVGEGAGALLGAGGKAIEGVGSNMADSASDAANGAQQQAAQDLADKAYAAIPKGLRQSHDLEGSLGFAGKLGLDTTNPQSLADAGSGATGILNDATNDALGQAGPVDASSYNDIVKNAIADKSGVLGSYDPVAAARGRLGPANTPAAKLLSQLQGYGAGVATNSADPTAVRGLVQQIGKAYDDATPTVTAATGAKDPVQVATHNALGEIYSKMKSVLYDRPEVADNFNALPPNIQAADVGGNQAIADDINQVLSQQQGHQPVLDAMKKYGNLMNTGNDAVTASKGLVPSVTNTAKVGGSMTPDNILNLGSVAEATLGHHPAALAIPLAAKAIENPAVVSGVGRGVSALGNSAVPGILGSAIGTSPNMIPGQAGAGTAVSVPQTGQLGGTLDQELNTYLAGAQNPYAASAYTSGLPGIVKQVQAANAAQEAEQNIAELMNHAGGAQGILGGTIASLIPGTAANAYGGQITADKAAIANAENQITGSQLTGSEIAAPRLNQDQSAAQASLGNMNSLIQTLLGQGQGNAPGLINAAYGS